MEKESVSFSIEVDVQLSTTVIDSVNRRIQEIRETAAKNTQSVDKSASDRLPPVREADLRYRIEIEMLPKQGILRVADEHLTALTDEGRPKQNRKPFLERIGNRLHLRMEGQAHPLYYERYLDYSILSRSHYPPHYPHLIAMQRELANWLTFYLEPRNKCDSQTQSRRFTILDRWGRTSQPFSIPCKLVISNNFNLSRDRFIR